METQTRVVVNREHNFVYGCRSIMDVTCGPVLIGYNFVVSRSHGPGRCSAKLERQLLDRSNAAAWRQALNRGRPISRSHAGTGRCEVAWSSWSRSFGARLSLCAALHSAHIHSHLTSPRSPRRDPDLCDTRSVPRDCSLPSEDLYLLMPH